MKVKENFGPSRALHYFAPCCIHRKVHFGRFLVSASSCSIITLFIEIQQTLKKIAHANSFKSSPLLPRAFKWGLRLMLLLVACLSFSYFQERLSRSGINVVIKDVPISQRP